MANNKTNNGMDPRLENLLKDELSNRAKKIEAMKQWQRDDEGKKIGKSKLKIIYGAISSIAAMFLIGIFVINTGDTSDGIPGLSYSAAPIYRGALVDPSIYEAIEEGDTLEAIQMIDLSLLKCRERIEKLDSLIPTSENQKELSQRRQELNQECCELEDLKRSILYNK